MEKLKQNAQDAFKNEAKNEEVLEKPKKNEAKGFDYYRDIPGYPDDHKGFNKYDSILELEKKSEQEINDPEVAEFNESLKTVISKQENKNILSMVREVASSKAFRAAFISLMLFAKVGQASAENLKAKNVSENKIENSIKEEKTDKFAEGNYVAGYAEFLKIKATNYFETDKADIKPEATAEIQDNFREFLGGINNENFKDVISKNWVIKGSSDERATSNWDGSNENLTIARAEALQAIIKEALFNHKYKREQRLSTEQTMMLMNKKIEISYLKDREGKENGVTYISDKLNPETGQNYTENEITNIKKNNPELYQELLESCRFTNFETESNFFADAKNFDQVHFLIDESGSMMRSKHFISNHLRSIEMNKKINLSLYSDQINKEAVQCVSNEEAADKILKLTTEGSFRERQVNSTLGLINKIAAENSEKGNDAKKETHKIYVATDEAIQGTNSAVLELLQYKAAEVGANIEFLIGYQEWVGNQMEGYQKNSVVKVTLNELVDKVNKIKKLELANGVNKDVKSEKINDFSERNYQTKKAEFTAYLANFRSKEFRDLLSARGYGETAEEIADSLDKELSGPKNYAKLNDIIDIEKIKIEYIAKMSGRGTDAKLAEAVFNSARALRAMVEAKNERDLVMEAIKGIPGDKIPDIKDNVLINVIDDIAPVRLPVNGPNDLSSNLYY